MNNSENYVFNQVLKEDSNIRNGWTYILLNTIILYIQDFLELVKKSKQLITYDVFYFSYF